MSKWSELAPPSIKYVQSRSLPEVHSPLAREPNTTRLVSSEVYPGILLESSLSSSSRVLRAASRQVRSRPELGCSAEVAAVDSMPGIEDHSSNLCALRFDVDQVRHPDSPIWTLNLFFCCFAARLKSCPSDERKGEGARATLA